MKPSNYKKIQEYIEWLLDEWEIEYMYEMCMLIAKELDYALSVKSPLQRSMHMYDTAGKLDIGMNNLNEILPKMVDKVFEYTNAQTLAQNRELDEDFAFDDAYYQIEEYQKQNAKDQFAQMYYGYVTSDHKFRDPKNTFINAVSIAEMQGVDSLEARDKRLQEIGVNIGGRGMCAYNPDDMRITTLSAKAKEIVGYTVEQLTQANADNIADIYNTDYVEVTAHYGARPTHAVWQGKVYKIHGEEEGYPNLYTATELGQITGLKGINCRHDYYPYIMGRSKREYTDAELEAMLPENNRFVWQGKEYDGYTATQKQRAYERRLRKIKNELVMADAFKQEDQFRSWAIKYRQVLGDYHKFSEVAKLPPQVDRYQIRQYDTALNTRVYEILNKGL